MDVRDKRPLFSIAKESLLDANERYVDVFYDGIVRQSVFGVYTNLCNMKVRKYGRH